MFFFYYNFTIFLASHFRTPSQRDRNIKLTLLMRCAIFLDSVCNDVCTHVLSFAANSAALDAASRLIAEQAARAADELAQHDVAVSVLQAGPTSPARARDIARRKRAARKAVGSAREAEAFAHLRSAAAAEARRINGPV